MKRFIFVFLAATFVTIFQFPVLYGSPASACRHHSVSSEGGGSSPSYDKYDRLCQWYPANASIYPDYLGTAGEACGDEDRKEGMATAGVSEFLFRQGRACGKCYEVRSCVAGHPNTSITLTVTEACPSEATNCSPPSRHFLLPSQLMEKIAGVSKDVDDVFVPIEYRTIVCERGVRYTTIDDGQDETSLTVLISNLAGFGTLTEVEVMGLYTGWLSMVRVRGRGQRWHIGANLKGQPLSFKLTTTGNYTSKYFKVAPSNWTFGQTYIRQEFVEIEERELLGSYIDQRYLSWLWDDPVLYMQFIESPP